MELAVTPPAKAVAGVALRDPIVVTFSTPGRNHVRGRGRNRRTGDTSLVPSLSDMSGVWVHVSLMSPDQHEMLAPPRTDLLRGRTADSVHPVFEDQPSERHIVGYATFPDLVISERGRYCFRINVIDMNMYVSPVAARRPTCLTCHRPTRGDRLASGRILQAIHSDPFEVMDGAQSVAEGQTSSPSVTHHAAEEENRKQEHAQDHAVARDGH